MLIHHIIILPIIIENSQLPIFRLYIAKDEGEDDVIKLKFLMSGILVIQFVYFVKIIIARYYILLPQSDLVLVLVTN
jgi:hypothetical protein